MKGNHLLLTSHMWTFISSFILAAILPKILGVSDYILVMQSIAIVGLFVPICTFATPTYLIRQYKVSKGGDLVVIVTKLFILGLVVSALLFFPVSIQYLDYDNGILVRIILVLIVAMMAVLNIFSGLSRMQSDAFLYFHSVATSKLLILALIYLLSFYVNLTADLFVYGWFISLIITFLFIKRRAQRSINKLLECNNYGETVNCFFKDSFIFCYPIVISNCLVVALPFIERLVIPSVISETDVALYIFNVDVIGKISAVSLLILKVVVFPHILKFELREQVSRYRYYLKRLVIFVVLILICSYFVVFFLLEYIYSLLGYLDFFNATVIYMTITAFCLVSLNYMLTISFAIIGRNEILMLTTLTTLLFHYFGILYIGSEYGVVGISISYLSSIGVVTIILGFVSTGKLNAYKASIS